MRYLYALTIVLVILVSCKNNKTKELNDLSRKDSIELNNLRALSDHIQFENPDSALKLQLKKKLYLSGAITHLES